MNDQVRYFRQETIRISNVVQGEDLTPKTFNEQMEAKKIIKNFNGLESVIEFGFLAHIQ